MPAAVLLPRRPASRSRLAEVGGFDLVWAAFALVLVFEGLLPLINPAAWRRTMQRALSLSDGQLRFFGLLALLAGGVMLAVVLG